MADQSLRIEDLEESGEFQSSDASREEGSYTDNYQDTHHMTSEDIIRNYKEQAKQQSNYSNNKNGHQHDQEIHHKEARSQNSSKQSQRSRSSSSSYDSRQEQVELVERRNDRNEGVHHDEDDEERTRSVHSEQESYDSQGESNNQEEEEEEAVQERTIENASNGRPPCGDVDDDNKEFFDYLDSFGDNGERVVPSSSDTEVGGDMSGPKIIHLDHVDYILDNIDAELSHLINKSMVKTVYARKHTSPGSERSQSRQSSRHGRRNQAGGHHHRDGTDEGTEDTGLGSGSHIEETEENNNVTKKSSKQHYAKEKRRTSTPLKIPIIEVSDADSVTSEEVQVRLQETLHKHDPAPPSHVHPKSHPSTPLAKRLILENYSKLDSEDIRKIRDFGRQDRNNRQEDVTEESHQHQSVSRNLQHGDSRNLQHGVSRNSQHGDSKNLQHGVSRNSQHDDSRRSQRPRSRTTSHRSRSLSQSTATSGEASERSRPPSRSSTNQERSRRRHNESIATEDYEHAFNLTRTPSRATFMQPFIDTSSSKKTTRKKEHRPVKANHQIHIFDSQLYMDDPPATRKPHSSRKHHKSSSVSDQHLYMDETPASKKPHQTRRHHKSSTEPGSGRPSGLPEYMYLRRDIRESDVGSDSIMTEDYEGVFAAAMIPHRTDINPKSSSLQQRRKSSPKTYGGSQMSDPESIRTEEFERHFRGLMVKQVAGVPVRNFDSVTINSDLDLVRTTEVHNKFQDALNRSGTGSNKGGSYRVRSTDSQDSLERHRSGKHRKLQRAKRVMDSDSDRDSEGVDPLSSELVSSDSKDSDRSLPQVSAKNDHHNSGGERKNEGQTNKRAKRAREKEKEQRQVASANQSPLRKLLSPGSPRKSKSFPEITTPIGGSTPEKSPSCSPPRTPTLLVPPPRFKDHSKLRQTRSFDETLRPRQGQQPPVYQWSQEHYLPHHHSPKFSNSRQDSVSTYEEVESLSSHQVSSANSRSTSEGPSRLPSFGSSGNSLDRSGDYAAIPWKFGDGLILMTERASSASVSRSGSFGSSSPSHSFSGSKHSPRSSISDGTQSTETDMQSDVAKWVDQTRVETARKHSDSGLPNVEVIKSNEAPEKSNAATQEKQSLPLLNMECGDVIAGESVENIQLPHETEREIALKLRNTSPAPPLSVFSRTASFDSSISSYSDLRSDIAWTPAEDVLMNLGFAGPDLGIPERFLRSWQEKMYQKKMETVRKLLRSHSSQSEPDFLYPRRHMMEKVQEEPDPGTLNVPAAVPKQDPYKLAAPEPTPVVVKERVQQQQKPNSPSPSIHVKKPPPQHHEVKHIATSKACDASTDTSDLPAVHHHPDNSNHGNVPKGLPSQTSVERLHQHRKRLMKAATVSNFGKTLADMARSRKGGQPNIPPGPPPPHRPNDIQQMQQDLHQRMNMIARKPRSAGRGRRNKYFVKQSSLPVSLETLPEEEELGKPRGHDMRSQRSISLDTDEPFRHVPLKIVMEQPSIESREAMSRQGTCDVDIDEAIADVEVDHKLPDKIEKYLTVVKDIMESKDSGFENELSQSGSPQLMSPQSGIGDFNKSIETVLHQKQPNLPSKMASNSSHREPSPVKHTAGGKENQHPEEMHQDDVDTHLLGVNKKDCLEVLSTTSSRSDDSVLSENKSNSSRRSSVSSDKSVGPRPSLVDMQEVFCQTIEEDDDSVFMTSPVPACDADMVECVCICIQTSPDMLSPPLSPLECGVSYSYAAQEDAKSSKPGRSKRIGSGGFAVHDVETGVGAPVDKPAILVRTMSNACSQASLDTTEPLLLDHAIKTDFKSNAKQPYQTKSDISVENRTFTDASETKTSNDKRPQLQQNEDQQIQPVVQQVTQAEHVTPIEALEASKFFATQDDRVSTRSLPTDTDDNSTEWPEMGQSPTLDEMDTFVQDTSAGFMSDASDVLPESEEEQLAEKVTQLRRRRSLRPEWATPEKKDHQSVSRTSSQVGSSSDGSEVSVGRRANMKLPLTVKQGSEVKSDTDDKASDLSSTSEALSVVTDKVFTDDSSPGSVYKYAQFVAAKDGDDKPEKDLIRSNSDLIKRLSDSRSTLSSLATPHTPLKRSLSVEALNPYFMRPRTLSERGPRQSEINFIDTGKHYNTLRGTASTGGYKSRIKMPMNTPEVLKLASMKLERLIHKGTLKPITFDDSFQEEDEVTIVTSQTVSNPPTLQANDSKQTTEKIRDDHISLPDKANEAFMTPNSYLYPTPSSDRVEQERASHVRQNSNLSDRSHGSSDKSLQSPSTRSPSIPSIFTKGPTLESHDSLEVVCFAAIGEEKRPPLRSRDFGAWSSVSTASSPGFLTIPSFHSPDLPDFESRPRTTSPSDLCDKTNDNKTDITFSLPTIDAESADESNLHEESASYNNANNAKLNAENLNTLSISIPNQLILSPLSPRRFDYLFENTPSTGGSDVTPAVPIKEDSNDSANENTSDTDKYYSSTHHEIGHTIPLPKLTINENGSKVPMILHKLATIPTIEKDKQFTIHLELPPLNYNEMNNNNNILEPGKQNSLQDLSLSPKDMIDSSDRDSPNRWISEKHYQAPYYWDIADSIPVFPLYRDGHFTSDVPNPNNLIPRNDNTIIPTFDEICSKAGRLIQNLERTVMTGEVFQPVDPAPVQRTENGGQEDTNGMGSNPHGMGSNPQLVVINVMDHASEDTNIMSNSDGDVIQDEQGAIEEETIRMSQQVGLQASAGISKAHKKKLSDNPQGTPPDWGAKLESLANLEDLMETEREMRRRLDSLEKSFDDVKTDKQVALKELKTLQETVHRNKSDIHKAEEMTAKNLEKADGIRSELMVLEYQRDQARRELEDLEENIDARRGSPGLHSPNYGTSWNSNASDQDLLNMTANQIRGIIQERDDLKSRLRKGQGDLSPTERSELERQLSATKTDLFNEQKSSRVKIEQMEEELEESRLKIDDLSKQKLDLSAQVEQLNASLLTAEDNASIHETSHLEEEIKHLQQSLQDKDEYIVAAKASVREKEQTMSKQREELMRIKRQLTELKETNETLMQERKEDFKKLSADKVLAMDEVRDVMKKENRLAMDQIRYSLEKDKKECLARQEEKLQEQMAVKHSLLLTKEEELMLLKEDMSRMKRTMEQDEEERTLSMQKKIEEAIEKAKEVWDEEMGRNKRREQAMREEEFAKETARLHEDIRKEKRMTENTEATIASLKEEIAELQEKRLAAGREKVEAVSEARDTTRQEMQAECDNLRQQLTQEKNSEMASLKEKILQRDAELEKLRSEMKKKLEQKAKETETIDKTSSRGIISEINEECKRTATIIGTHKKMNSLKNDRNSKSPSPSSSSSFVNGYHGSTPGKTQVMAALTNLRTSNEELRNYVQTVKDDLEKQKKITTKLQKDKEAEAKHLQEQLQQEKSLDSMKDQLVKDHLKVVDNLQKSIHSLQSSETNLKDKLSNKDEELREIQRSMAKWKEESAYKMAQKFEEELNRELEIRLKEKEERKELLRKSPMKSKDQSHGSPSSSTTGTPPTDASTVRMLRNLQERVRALQAENIDLRKSGRSSQMESRSPQASQNEVSEKEQQIYQLQQKVMLLDRQLHIAEDRCRDNAAHLSEKGSENSKLQSALAQQTKELMRMERAYAKLSQSATRRPPVAL